MFKGNHGPSLCEAQPRSLAKTVAYGLRPSGLRGHSGRWRVFLMVPVTTDPGVRWVVDKSLLRAMTFGRSARVFFIRAASILSAMPNFSVCFAQLGRGGLAASEVNCPSR